MAEKNIDDYIHFYIGQKCLIGKTRIAEIRGVIWGAHGNVICIIDDNKKDNVKIDCRHIKPILRNLVDMSLLEEDAAYEIEFKSVKKELTMEYYFQSVDCWLPETVLYLTSKGFDLFGLINAGLAINK